MLEIVRDTLDEARAEIGAGRGAPSHGEIVDSICERAEAHSRDWPRRVINATGVVLHTNLGARR